ncbi:MAG: hypothetical protein Q4C91_06100 [Eubacteriales bacterium]|nr:hypothetical protein [Eubacteriales bacterium]
MDIITWIQGIKADQTYEISKEDINSYPQLVQPVFGDVMDSDKVSVQILSNENMKIRAQVSCAVICGCRYENIGAELDVCQAAADANKKSDVYQAVANINTKPDVYQAAGSVSVSLTLEIGDKCPLAGFGMFHFEELTYIVSRSEGSENCFHQITGVWRISETENNKLAVSFSGIDFRYGVFFEMSRKKTDSYSDGEYQGNIGLEKLLDLIGIDEKQNIIPKELAAKISEYLVIKDFSISYNAVKNTLELIRFSLEIGGELSWSPVPQFEVRLTELGLGVLDISGNPGAPGKCFDASVSGEITMASVVFPICVSYYSGGNSFFVTIKGTDSNIDLKSIFSAWLSGFDMECLPFGIDNVSLGEFMLTYDAGRHEANSFQILFSIDTDWSILGFAVKNITVGIKKDQAFSWSIHGDFSIADAPFSVEALWDENSTSVSGYLAEESYIKLSDLWNSLLKGSRITLPDLYLSHLRIELDNKKQEESQSAFQKLDSGKQKESRPAFLEQEKKTEDSGFSVSGIVCLSPEENKSAFRSAEFAAVKKTTEDGTPWKAFALEIQGNFAFSEIPFVGNVIPQLDRVSLENLIFLYSSQEVKGESIGNLIDTVTAPSGFTMIASLNLGEEILNFQGSLGTNKPEAHKQNTKLLPEMGMTNSGAA